MNSLAHLLLFYICIKFRKRSRLERQEEKQTQAAARQEQKKLKKQIQKQQIKRDYAKAKRSEQTVGTATKGTIDYIKKIGGKVTNFFKENRKVYISVAVLIGLMFLIITNVTSCSAVFLQNVITYTGTLENEEKPPVITAMEAAQ